MWFVILKALLPEGPLYFRKFQVLGQRSRKCCSSRMTPMQHTRIHARCQSARRLSCRVFPESTAPDKVRAPSPRRAKNTSRRVGAGTDATLDDMGYRGEDVPGSHGDRGRQMPWQPSSGAAPGSTGAWGGEPGGYPGGENYPPPDGGGPGYGQDGGYAGQGYGQHDGQYGAPYPQQPYEQQQPSPYEQQQPYGQYNGYGQGQGQSGAGGYGGPQEYPQQQHD